MINWSIRYAALLARHPELCDPRRRVLEVGSGSEGIARFLKRPVVGLDQAFPGTPHVHLLPVCGSVLHLPFADATFDDVVCVDTLEHLPGSERPAAVRELIRVAAKQVIISGPFGAFAQYGDTAYADVIRRTGGAVPAWLEEHLRHGIPTLGDLLEILIDAGNPFALHVNERMIQHYAGLLAENLQFVAGLGAVLEQKFPLASPLCAAEGDLPYSYLVTIDKSTARRISAAVAAAETPTTRVGVVAPPPGNFAMFAVGHRADRMPAIPNVRRIFAGADARQAGLDVDILRDDTGDSIAQLNPAFSEMTAIYWVWKNVADLDAVGFCHYRRYFDLRPSEAAPARETRLRTSAQVSRHQDRFADRAAVGRLLADGGIVVARPSDPGVPASVAEQYMIDHVPGHYLVMLKTVLARQPHLAPQLVAQVRDRRLTANNMFVMRWTDFDRLCRLWFDILFAIDAELPTRPSGYQQRVIAFLSERVFDLHIRWLRDSGRRIVECPIFYLDESAFACEA